MWCERVVRNTSDPRREPDAPVIDYVDITWDECRPVLKKRSRGGEEVRVLLHRTERLRHGDVLLETADRAVVINVLPCEVIVVRSDDARLRAELAFDLGNLHQPMQIGAGELIFLEAEAAMEAVEMLRLSFSRELKRFEPLPVPATLAVKVSADLRILRSSGSQPGGPNGSRSPSSNP